MTDRLTESDKKHWHPAPVVIQFRMISKRCNKCDETKPIGEFYNRSSAKDGHQARCKICADTYWYAYKEKNREKVRAYVKEYNRRPENVANRKVYMERWYRASPRQNLRTSLSKALRRAPTETPVTLDELCELFETQGGRCALTGLVMTWRSGKIMPTSISLDRIHPERGYVLGNVRLVCYCVNAFRQQMSDSEMFSVALAMVSNMKPRLKAVS